MSLFWMVESDDCVGLKRNRFWLQTCITFGLPDCSRTGVKIQVSQTFYLLSLLPCRNFSSPVISKSTWQSPFVSVGEDLLSVLRGKVFYLICSWALLWTKEFKRGCTRWDHRFIQLSILSLTVVKRRCLPKNKRNGLASMGFALGSIKWLLVTLRFPGQKVFSLCFLSLSSRSSHCFALNSYKFLASAVSCGYINTGAY